MIIALSAASAGAATAQSIEGQLGVASEYVGKGLGKSAGDPSLNGSLEVSYADFYGGVSASTAKLSQGSDAEIVTSLGWRPKAAGVAFDLSLVNRDLPGTRAGIDSNFWEYQADASRKFGRVSGRLRVNYTPDGFAATKEAWWIEAQASTALGPRTRASAAYGVRSADGGADYNAWNLGVKHNLSERFAADVRWYDTDSHALGDNYDGRLVGALTYAF
nr:TorF family putative porin [Brevundimonas diminuta]